MSAPVANLLSRQARTALRTSTALLTSTAVIAAMLALPAVAGATPHPVTPQPTVAEVKQQLGTLAMKNSQLVDKFDRAQSDVQAKQRAAAQAVVAAARAAKQLDQAHIKFSAGAAAMYEGGSFSATGALLSSTSGTSYLDQLDTLSMLSSHSAQIVTAVSAAQKLAKAARTRAQSLLASATQKRDALAKEKVQVQGQIDKYKTLLDKLNAAQRAAFLAKQSPVTSKKRVAVVTKAVATSLPTGLGKTASAKAKIAVQFALAQVGKPYVWGSAGPGSYDCSGLTMSAWHAAGVSLPHSALQQYSYGKHVSFDQMVPGDLEFFYSPIGHVAIYIGNGLMVSAPQTGENVMVIPADTFHSDFAGATHLG